MIVARTHDRIRVFLVDDSVVIRRILSEMLSCDPSIEIAGIAPNGMIALSRLRQQLPDLVILDLEMPGMSGFDTLRSIRRDYPNLPVLIFSVTSERGTVATLDAIRLGANDYLHKPFDLHHPQSQLERTQAELIQKVKRLVAENENRNPTATSISPKLSNHDLIPENLDSIIPSTKLSDSWIQLEHGIRRYDLLVIGVSTGGPQALVSILPDLPEDFPIPVVIALHMPRAFTSLFVRRLQSICKLPVSEGMNNQRINHPQIILAPGDRHLELTGHPGEIRIRIHEQIDESYCRPSVDLLFRSASQVCGAKVFGIIMTGMGRDGLVGARKIVENHGTILAQDQSSSVVWGMPGFVVAEGLASAVLPLKELIPRVNRIISRFPRSTKTVAPITPLETNQSSGMNSTTTG